MAESDDRTGPGDDAVLAPVIPLFGARSSDPAGPASPSSAHPAYRSLIHADDRTALRETYPDDDPLDEPGLEIEDRPGEILAARDAALRALGRRDLSQRELERFLRDTGFDDHIATEVAQDMRDRGYQDDAAFAQNLVGRLQERKGLGRTAIAAELAGRMFSPAAISYALELVDSGDEIARARELAAKRASQLRGLDRETAVRRLSGYLQRRGYSGSTVRTAVDAALPATGTSGGGRSGPRFE